MLAWFVLLILALAGRESDAETLATLRADPALCRATRELARLLGAGDDARC